VDSNNNVLATGFVQNPTDLNGDGDTADSEESNGYGGTDIFFVSLSAVGSDVSSCSEGTRCSDIVYNGGTLAGSTTYYWRIRYYDDADGAGDWSAGSGANYFSTAANSAPNAPQTPHCEGSTTPVTGVGDLTPEFSAIYDDDNTSDTAEYYEISGAIDIA